MTVVGITAAIFLFATFEGFIIPVIFHELTQLNENKFCSCSFQIDLTGCNGLFIVLAIILALLILAIIYIFFYSKSLTEKMHTSGVIVVILAMVYNFCFLSFHQLLLIILFQFVAVDTQLIFGGRQEELIPDSVIIGVVLLYADIIFIFCNVLNAYDTNFFNFHKWIVDYSK